MMVSAVSDVSIRGRGRLLERHTPGLC